MQIVIDIPKIEYEHLTNKEKFYSLEKSKQEWLINKALNCIVNGVTLPKGYGRLIDADKIHFENVEFDTYGDYSRAFDAIDQADTIIEADKESK